MEIRAAICFTWKPILKSILHHFVCLTSTENMIKLKMFYTLTVKYPLTPVKPFPPSNIILQTEKVERERERERDECETREREIGVAAGSSSTPSSRSSPLKTDPPKIDLVLDPKLIGVAVLAIVLDRRSISLSLDCRIWWIFFVGFFFFCVYLLRNDIIYLFGSWENLRKCEQQVKNVFSIVFSRIQPNIRKYFIKHFLKWNQTLKNIFISRKYFHLKIFYTWKIFYTKTNAA